MDYKKVFIKKELLALLGKNKRNLTVAAMLLTVAIFTVSLSLGVFEELSKRMDNPYTNWVTMPVLYQYREGIPELKNHFNNEANLSKYNLKNVSGYVKWSLKFLDPKSFMSKEAIGRSLDFEDDIADKIFEKSNVIALKENFTLGDDSNRFDIFVSEEFCSILNIDKKTSAGKDVIVRDYTDDFVFLFKIGGILKTLPNHSHFVVSQDFFNMFKENYVTTGFISVGNQTRLNIVSSAQLDQKKVEQLLAPINIIVFETEQREVAGGTKMNAYNIYTQGFITDSTALGVSSQLKNAKHLTKLLKVWNPVSGFSELSDPMYLSFNFRELDKIRELQEFLKENYKMEIELSVVEDRDNFSMVSKLTYFMIISLIIVSLISFSIFLYNLISSHLDKIKANIGTFMAFGFNGKVISQIYITTVMKFMAYAWGVSFITLFVLWVLGYVTRLYALSIFHPIVIISFVLFNAIALSITYMITSKLLKETPGDLIYNRV